MQCTSTSWNHFHFPFIQNNLLYSHFPPLFVENRVLFLDLIAGICWALSCGHSGARRSGNTLDCIEDLKVFALALLSCHAWQIAAGLWYPRFLFGPGHRLVGSSDNLGRCRFPATLAGAVTPKSTISPFEVDQLLIRPSARH